MKISMDKIKVAARIRKEVGKIDELAENIRAHGLISPIAVMQLEGGEYQLLAGLRRLRAMELNGETEIDAKVFPSSDAEVALKIEYFENEQREPFTFSEKMDYARLIEEIEGAKAKERQMAGKKLSDHDLPDGSPEGQKRETRDIVGAKIDMSGRQYARAKFIVENASPEIIEELDRGERNIYQTYNELLAEKHAAVLSASDTPVCAKPKPDTVPQSNAEPKLPVAPPAPKPTPRPPSIRNDPLYEKLCAQEAEAERTRQKFDSSFPEDTVADLQQRLKEASTRATDAESKLDREKELRHNEMYHYTATIEMLKGQLAKAETIIEELLLKYEPDKHLEKEAEFLYENN